MCLRLGLPPGDAVGRVVVSGRGNTKQPREPQAVGRGPGPSGLRMIFWPGCQVHYCAYRAWTGFRGNGCGDAAVYQGWGRAPLSGQAAG